MQGMGWDRDVSPRGTVCRVSSFELSLQSWQTYFLMPSQTKGFFWSIVSFRFSLSGQAFTTHELPTSAVSLWVRQSWGPSLRNSVPGHSKSRQRSQPSFSFSKNLATYFHTNAQESPRFLLVLEAGPLEEIKIAVWSMFAES